MDADSFKRIRSEIVEAAENSGRPSHTVRLIAVSKRFPIEEIQRVEELGQKDFGENYVQEALPKVEVCKELGLIWHFIGHLQRNKAKSVVGVFEYIHSLDNLALAKVISSRAQTLAIEQKVLLQINIGNETSKTGLSEDEAEDLLHKVQTLPGIRVVGLMALPPLVNSEIEARNNFSRVAELRDQWQASIGVSLPELSMGTSADYRWAIAEGATMVRVGTAIFGERKK